MKFRKFMQILVLFVIFIGIKTYLPKVDYIVDKEPDDLISQPKIEKETKIGDRDNILIEEEADKITGENEGLDTDNPEPIFTSSPLSEEIIERITGISYKENDEVKIEDLAYIQVTYWGFDDKEHIGELIVNRKVAEDVVEIFGELYGAKFPIEKINLIDEYNANDELSMSDNNSSAFCYREITGSKGKISNHGYGVAIDINPVQNPYVKNNAVLPESGREYLDRNDIRKGMIVEGDACYNAFKSRGWTWGGEWKSLKDYQHFEFNLPAK